MNSQHCSIAGDDVVSAPRLVPDTMPDQPNVLPDEQPAEPRPGADAARHDRRNETGLGWMRPSSVFGPDGAQDLRERWDLIQARFLSDPSSAAKEADELLSCALDRVERRYWFRRGGADVDFYRAFFCRLLSM